MTFLNAADLDQQLASPSKATPRSVSSGNLGTTSGAPHRHGQLSPAIVLRSDAEAYLTAGEQYEDRLKRLSRRRKDAEVAISGANDAKVLALVERLRELGVWGTWRIEKAVREQLQSELGLDTSQLMERMVTLAQLHAAPVISSFHVGAVGLGVSGDMYLGPNVEFSSGVYSRDPCLRHTIHAEQAVVLTMLSHRERGLRSLYISHVPCGVCRQFLCELKSHADLDVWTPQFGGIVKLGSLLPFSFGPEDLGQTAALLDDMGPNPIALSHSSQAKLADRALAEEAEKAAQRAYAPYTASYAGVAIRLVDGRLISGHSVESVAFNPTVSPLQVALIALMARGGKPSDILKACFAEDPRAATHFKASDTSLLYAVAPQAEIWYMPLQISYE